MRVPAVHMDSDGYTRRLVEELGQRDVLLALPASDAALLALAAPGHDLIDKSRLADRAEEAGLTGAPGIVATGRAEISAAAETYGFPVVIKPTVSHTPAAGVAAPEALEQFLQQNPSLPTVLVQPYLAEPIHAVAGLIWNGDLLLAVHQRYLRTWPVDCGTSSAAVTTAVNEPLEAGLVRLLEGYQGIFQAQFAGEHLLDLNLRVYGSLPLAVAAGVNLPAALCRLVAGGSVARCRAEAGHRYRWPEGDIRNLLARRRAGDIGWLSVAAALRPHLKTAHSVYRLSDPKPVALRVAHATSRARSRGAPRG